MIDLPKFAAKGPIAHDIQQQRQQQPPVAMDYYYNFQINQGTMTTVQIHPQPKTKRVKFFHDNKVIDKHAVRKMEHQAKPGRDVKIILGGGLTEKEENIDEHGATKNLSPLCIRWHYSSVLFARSEIIRKKMKPIKSIVAESKREDSAAALYYLRLPFITVQVWDLMMIFLDFPAKQDGMTVQQALTLAPYYDAYGFTDGLDACDNAVKEYLESLPQQERDMSLNVGLLVKSLIAAFAAHLPRAYEVGIRYLKKKLLSKDYSSYGCLMFSRDHIQQLVPVIAQEVESDADFRKRFPFKTTASVNNDLFPGYYLNYAIGNQALEMVSQALTKLVVLGSEGVTSTRSDGVISRCSSLNGVYRRHDGNGKLPQAHVCYERKTQCEWNSRPVIFSIQLIPQKGWFILARHLDTCSSDTTTSDESSLKKGDGITGTVLWMSPQSHSTAFPPKTSWKPLATSAQGDLHVEYVYG